MMNWTFEWALRNFVAELFMPPGLILLFMIGVFFFTNKEKYLISMFILSSIFLWITSTTFFSQCLVKISEPIVNWPVALTEQHLKSIDAQVIVVLGAGRRKGAFESFEYNKQDLTKETLERLRYAAFLCKKTKLPILVSGGAPDRTNQKDLTEAMIMKQVLEKEYGLKTHWVETQSNTTRENAQFSSTLLEKNKIRKILLVTHYWHMPRAKRIFEEYGLKVIQAPHGYNIIEQYTPLDFYPNALDQTRRIWHELLGNIWYKIYY